MNVEVKKHARTVPANIKRMNVQPQKVNRNASNCITYNRFSKEGKVNENHSALSKGWPSLQTVLKRYRDNVEY
jgi:hypothetical protein